jgi:hypothetical protein
VLAPLELPSHNLDGNAHQRTFQLHEASIEGDPAIHGGEEAKCAFVSDVRCLDCHAVLQGRQQRENGALREIGVLEETARLAYNGAERELDRFKVELDTRAARWLEGAEQAIGDLVWVHHWFECEGGVFFIHATGWHRRAFVVNKI